jgi:hypothetical protein
MVIVRPPRRGRARRGEAVSGEVFGSKQQAEAKSAGREFD